MASDYGRVNARAATAGACNDPRRVRHLLRVAERYVADAKRFLPDWPYLIQVLEADVRTLQERLQALSKGKA